MNKQMQELNKKTNEELAALIMRLRSQLLESRFKQIVGEIEKTHTMKQMRQMIARCMYILRTRNLKISLGVHGIYLINIADNKSINVTEAVDKIINKESETKDSKVKKTETKTAAEKATEPTTKGESK